MTRLPKDFGSPQGRFTGEAQGKVARDPRRDRGDPVAGTAPPKGLLCTDRQPVAHHRRAGGDRGPQDQTDDPFSQRNTQDARHQRQSEVRAQPCHPPKRLASVCFGTDLGGPATARIVAVPAQHTSQRCSVCGQVDRNSVRTKRYSGAPTARIPSTRTSTLQRTSWPQGLRSPPVKTTSPRARPDPRSRNHQETVRNYCSNPHDRLESPGFSREEDINHRFVSNRTFPSSTETSCTAAISFIGFGVLALGNAVAPDNPSQVATSL